MMVMMMMVMADREREREKLKKTLGDGGGEFGRLTRNIKKT